MRASPWDYLPAAVARIWRSKTNLGFRKFPTYDEDFRMEMRVVVNEFSEDGVNNTYMKLYIDEEFIEDPTIIRSKEDYNKIVKEVKKNIFELGELFLVSGKYKVKTSNGISVTCISMTKKFGQKKIEVKSELISN